ncbi:hypothetical protein Pmani_008630 [Petrolisthes manimaculis]|uniref:Uncharacterized protein n=1 Tax=Petrolisthes manimaculis TaxID=1843537 RepID=A0AAE1Q5X6_9EUCA|nr:hypothetical protein Pmani_008630 [Petrolisthes manimaculis]
MAMVLLKLLAFMAMTMVERAGLLLIWNPKLFKIILTTLIMVSLPGGGESQVCPKYFPRDALDDPLSLPGALQFKPSTSQHWKTHWQMLSAEGTPEGCLLIQSNTTETTVRSSATSCWNLTQDSSSWDNTVSWPPFVRGEGNWENFYTLFLSPTQHGLTLQLNQQHDTELQQNTNTNVTTMEKVNATDRGPIVQLLSNLENTDGCTLMSGCENGWSYLSVSPSDDIFLLTNPTQDEIEVKVSLSDCFPEYKIGVYKSPALMFEVGEYKRSLSSSSLSSSSDSEMLVLSRKLELSYSHWDRYQTLTAKIDSQIILSETVDHRGLDCSGDWYLVGVRGARVTPNCHPISASTSSMKQRLEVEAQYSHSHSTKLVNIPAVVMNSIIVLYVIW